MAISAQTLLKDVQAMNAFGPRLTGTRAHAAFIAYLKTAIREMGIEVYSDPLFFHKWEDTAHSLQLEAEDGSLEDVHVSSVHPYSGETPPGGYLEELVYIKNPAVDYLKVAGKIALVEVGNVDFIPSEVPFDKRSAWPEDVTMPKNYEGPVITTFVKVLHSMLGKLGNAKAIILIWKGLPDACVEGQYLPFNMGYCGIPMLWVNETAGSRLVEAAAARRRVKFLLTAEREEMAYTESFYAILPGKNKKECVIVNTHTDGPNCIEENGPIALLALLRECKNRPLERTHIFLFTTGHFRLPQFKDIRTGAFQSASLWMERHRNLWEGGNNELKCVANLTPEHLGCMERTVTDGEYRFTGQPELELVYTGNSFMDQLYIEAVKQRKTVRTMTLQGHNLLHFGEGQNFFTMGIPGICLVPAPYGLCMQNDTHLMEQFSPELMAEQVETFLSLIEQIELTPTETLGKSDGYRFGFGNSVSGGRDFTPGAILGELKDNFEKMIKKDEK
ncbi:MAG: hypothetical protein IJT27_07675 [Clostridia bacterium]|nr:hypothetical protein [Clostridia bacterium]